MHACLFLLQIVGSGLRTREAETRLRAHGGAFSLAPRLLEPSVVLIPSPAVDRRVTEGVAVLTRFETLCQRVTMCRIEMRCVLISIQR